MILLLVTWGFLELGIHRFASLVGSFMGLIGMGLVGIIGVCGFSSLVGWFCESAWHGFGGFH